MKMFAKSMMALITLFAIAAQAEEKVIVLNGEQYELIYDGVERVEGGIRFNEVRLRDSEGNKYLITNGMGWGKTPLNTICEQASGNPKLRFADAYGQLDIEDSVIFKKKIAVFEPNHDENGKFSHLSVREGGVYLKNLDCESRKSDSSE